MKHTKAKAIALACAVLGKCAPVDGEPPKGWFPSRSQPNEYAMSIDRDIRHTGKEQMYKADAFLGRRVQLTGYLRSKEVKDWAGLWMRVDASPGGEVLAFDNMQDRPIKGTKGLGNVYEIVLDVPKQSQAIALGLLLTRRGEVWLDDLKFEIVGKNTLTTGGTSKEQLPKAPVNLDFEE